MPAPTVLRTKNYLTILYEREQVTKAEIEKHGGRLVRFGNRRKVAFKVRV